MSASGDCTVACGQHRVIETDEVVCVLPERRPRWARASRRCPPPTDLLPPPSANIRDQLLDVSTRTCGRRQREGMPPYAKVLVKHQKMRVSTCCTQYLNHHSSPAVENLVLEQLGILDRQRIAFPHTNCTFLAVLVGPRQRIFSSINLQRPHPGCSSIGFSILGLRYDRSKIVLRT